jgi:hypothetical protein
MLRAEEARALGDPSFWEHLKRAEASAPGHAFVRRYKGEHFLMLCQDATRRGALDEAARCLESARGFLRGDPRLLGAEADLAEAQGDREGAAALLRKLLDASPDSAYLRRRIAAIE